MPIRMVHGEGFKVLAEASDHQSSAWLMVAIIGCGISVTIESLQFFFMRGFSEVDDVMHNTVGCLIGWFMVKGSWFRV